MVKDISSAKVDGKVFVVIAATYDYSASGCVVQFQDLKHVKATMSIEEVVELLSMHAASWGHDGRTQCVDHTNKTWDGDCSIPSGELAGLMHSGMKPLQSSGSG